MLEWILVLHVIAGAMWFGGQVYVEGLMAGAAKTRDSSTILGVAQRTSETSTRLFVLAAVLLLGTGVWIVLDVKSGYGFEMMFVSIGFLVVLIGLGLSLFYVRPRGAELKQTIEQEGLTSTAALGIAKKLGMVSHLMTLLVAVALVVMVLKTGE
jgi:uncharacterized membrane protein